MSADCVPRVLDCTAPTGQVRGSSLTNGSSLETLDSFVSRVQCVCDRVHNVLGHVRIDLAGQLDETYV